MSDAGDIITAITTDVETAVAGVTVVVAATHTDRLKTADLPWCRLVLDDYTVEPLDWRQETRTWTVYGILVVDGGTRDEMQIHLDAIRDQIFSDPTLDGSADSAVCAALVPKSNADDAHVYGEFGVQAVKVA